MREVVGGQRTCFDIISDLLYVASIIARHDCGKMKTIREYLLGAARNARRCGLSKADEWERLAKLLDCGKIAELHREFLKTKEAFEEVL